MADELIWLLHNPRPVVVAFTAPWCGSCRNLKADFAVLAAEYSPQVEFILLDIERVPQLVERFAIAVLPTTILIRAGRVQFSHAGRLNALMLRRFVAQARTG